ncbi:glycerol dehydrogenase [Grimontia hollisae]|uniref:Glycerol dehydrogenase n=2 Tax=Grimontia hollisae TaxID=673 RepID=D0I650_GRIHO|nr:glycerol dehydrogenase [Grimontia hollisae]AMG29054.1 glycerol dehydrogenase [Grimontia hollisae]EEY73364.1 glycerol dehydrogenase [Grimontia hollisae CIP 101886]MDF2186659.1 glycerol dehydrogenase [Grimontia hollisae]STO76989.1 Glycerol dehydrogenase [Grimontia hollisae]STO98243.1 Glycerol dehydrogenase [Grimontia hollisae]
MERIIISPGKYIQGPNAIGKLAQYVETIGSNPLILADETVQKIVVEPVSQSFSSLNKPYSIETFCGECSRPEIERLAELCRKGSHDIVIGIGGGKTLDTAKATAFYHNVPVVIVPTLASTDAPTSALSVIYTPEGEFSEYLLLPSNPNMVIMDTTIVAGAPVRLLVAGMGDALSTYFEARANGISGGKTMAGGVPTASALALAKLCYETLLADGLKAKISAINHLSSTALDNVIEANTYLSGIGFESGGLAAAHAVHNGLTHVEEFHHLYHGEKVAFGTLVLLTLENAPMEEIQTVLNFCKEVGLPTNLHQMGMKELDNEKLLRVAEASCAEGETIHNMPFPVTPSAVLSAIYSAHTLGL